MPDVAAFDFDGTLTEGGSVFDFLAALRGRGAVTRAALTLAPQLARAALVGGSEADRTKERLFERVLDGVPVDEAQAVAATFARDHLSGRLRAPVHRRFVWHRERGDRVVIVSASPELYVRVAGDELGADGVVATRLAVAASGTLTGRYEGANCRGEEKLRGLRRWIDARGDGGGRLWAYGNSRGDLRMLQAADVGVNVGRLGRLGRLRAFDRLDGTGPAGRDG